MSSDPLAGSTRARRRVGRGIAGKGGKTAGRGTKGQGARDTIPMGFEGGQLPLMQRIPKLRGFKNPFRVEYTPVNVGALEAIEGDAVDLAGLVALGLAHKGDLVKILGGGELTRALTGGGPRLLQVGRGARSPAPEGRSPWSPCRSATVARRPRATPSPTGSIGPLRRRGAPCSPVWPTSSGSPTFARRSSSR